MELQEIQSKIISIRDKYVKNEKLYYAKHQEKNRILRAKVSAVDKVLNELGLNNRGHVKGFHQE